MLIGPTSPAQHLPHDDSTWPQVSYRLASSNDAEAPELNIGAMIGLATVDEAVGATRVVPGSNSPLYKARRRHVGGEEESVPAELGPGDAMLYTGRTRHGGGCEKRHFEDIFLWKLLVYHGKAASGRTARCRWKRPSKTASYQCVLRRANITHDRWRLAMHLAFVVGWLTPEESSPLGAFRLQFLKTTRGFFSLV